MLRNLNATYAGKRILASPTIGVLASVIAAETAEGDQGPGILYNESIDPVYAGKYLRAWITNPPTVGSLLIAENGAIEGYDLPVGTHVFPYDLIVNDAYDSSSSFTVAVGVVNAVAEGGVGVGAGSGTGGDAAGQVAGTADGGTGSGTGTGTGGDAAGEVSATAEGGIGTGTGTGSGGEAAGEVSVTADGGTGIGTGSGTGGEAIGEAGGSATAAGGTGTGTGSGMGGEASGEISATADGGAGTGAGTGSGGDAVGGSADAVAEGGTGTGIGVGTGGNAVGSTDASDLQPSQAPWRLRSLPRVYRVASLPRIFKVTKMTRTLPTKDLEEVKKVTFDFSPDADQVSNPDITITAVSGNLESDVSEMKVGTPTESGPLVIQLIGGGEAGTTYRVRCKVNDPDGEVHVLAAQLPVATT